MKKVKEEEVIRATLEEVNIQYACVPERCGTSWILRCSSGWPQNSTVRIFTDSCEAFEYGLRLKKEGKLLPRSCNVSPFANAVEGEGGLLP